MSKKPFKLKKGAKLPVEMLPTIQNLAAMGLNESQIALVIGFSGKSPQQFIQLNKKKDPLVKEAWEEGKKMAKIEFIKSLIRSSLGYEYEETVEEYRTMPNGDMSLRPISQKRYKKYARPDMKAAELLAYNLMGDDFKRKAEVEHKSLNVELTGDMEKEQIRKLIGKLTDYVDKKPVESKEIDTTINQKLGQSSEVLQSDTERPEAEHTASDGMA